MIKTRDGRLNRKIDKTKKEKIGWMILAEKSLDETGNNKKDDKVLEKYIN